MNKDIIQGNWKELKGEVQKKWGKISNDEIDQMEGNREKLLGSIQKNYGVARDEAEKELKKWEDSRAA